MPPMSNNRNLIDHYDCLHILLSLRRKSRSKCYQNVLQYQVGYNVRLLELSQGNFLDFFSC